MAGGSSGGSPAPAQVVQPPNAFNTPLEQQLGGLGIRQLTAFTPYAFAGSGSSLLPRDALGQMQVPGPNPTIFGNPFQTGQYFGGASQGQQPQGQMGAGGIPMGTKPSPMFGATPPPQYLRTPTNPGNVSQGLTQQPALAGLFGFGMGQPQMQLPFQMNGAPNFVGPQTQAGQ